MEILSPSIQQKIKNQIEGIVKQTAIVKLYSGHKETRTHLKQAKEKRKQMVNRLKQLKKL